jgi:hypothetical protein
MQSSKGFAKSMDLQKWESFSIDQYKSLNYD